VPTPWPTIRQQLSQIEHNLLEATDHGNQSRGALRAQYTHGD